LGRKEWDPVEWFFGGVDSLRQVLPFRLKFQLVPDLTISQVLESPEAIDCEVTNLFTWSNIGDIGLDNFMKSMWYS